MTDTLLSNILSEEAKKVFSIAQKIATENMNPSFGAPHVMKALLHKTSGLIPVLTRLEKDYYYLEEWADVRIEEYAQKAIKGEPAGDDSITTLLEESESLQLKFGKDKIDPFILFTAIVTPGVAFNFDQMRSFPVKREELIQEGLKSNDLSEMLGAKNGEKGDAINGSSSLLKYCINKTEEARKEKLEPVVGRDKELRMMAEIFCRKSKPNVMITGEPGVGKTALVDGFAQAIVNKLVPENLQGSELYELDNSALISGASYKGEIEDRLKAVIGDIKKLDKAILFIDEIHNLADKNGPASGVANVLKPALAKGDIMVIGATTPEGFKKHIESDEGFNRRFEQLKIDEPDEVVSFQILRVITPAYSTHHQVQVPDEVLKESIRLAKRYIKDRRLPDAAIDILDRTMAALHLMNDTGKKENEILDQTINSWKEQADEAHDLDDWKWLARTYLQKLSPILLSQLSSEADAQKMETKEELVTYLQQTLEEVNNIAGEPRNTVEKMDAASIVSNKTGIPLGKLQSQEQERLLNIESILKKRVVGQDHAVKSIADAILESRSGLGKPGQPVGSFFFLGPTGTGKTELAKSLAEFLFLDESYIIRFDMSEFKEEHAAALLYGAPPGYVGYEAGGLLVNKIRAQPYAVVLFDEIEKAHPSVFDVFLQILDEGKLNDKLGKTGDFSNAVIIFTSNIGSNFIVEKFNEGKIPASAELIEIMTSHFRPEFLGRLTEIVPFGPMRQEMVRGILDIQLKSLYTALEKQGITLTIDNDAKDLLALQGFTPAYGARPLGGVIRNQLRRPLSHKIISGELKNGMNITLNKEGENLIWNKNTLT